LRTPKRSERGFTLIELLVVMLLLGLAFTYGLLNVDMLIPGSRLEKGARDLGNMLTRLRGMAVFHSRPYRLEYDLDEDRFRIIRPTTLAEQEEGLDEYIETDWFDLPKRVRLMDVQFSDRDRESSGIVSVDFLPGGEVTGHMVHLISDEIANEERNRFTVELNAITGLVSFTRGEKEYAGVRDEFEFR
jgi:prepilin-type N-terminal cleavage/methylation domain-containing protein